MDAEAAGGADEARSLFEEDRQGRGESDGGVGGGGEIAELALGEAADGADAAQLGDLATAAAAPSIAAKSPPASPGRSPVSSLQTTKPTWKRSSS